MRFAVSWSYESKNDSTAIVQSLFTVDLETIRAPSLGINMAHVRPFVVCIAAHDLRPRHPGLN